MLVHKLSAGKLQDCKHVSKMQWHAGLCRGVISLLTSSEFSMLQLSLPSNHDALALLACTFLHHKWHHKWPYKASARQP